MTESLARAIRLRGSESSRCPRLRLRFRGPLLRRVPCAAWTTTAGTACLTLPLYDSPPPPGRLTLRAPLRFVQKPSILRAFWRRVGAIDLRSKIKPSWRRSKANQSKGCWPLNVWAAQTPSRPAERSRPAASFLVCTRKSIAAISHHRRRNRPVFEGAQMRSVLTLAFWGERSVHLWAASSIATLSRASR